MSLSTAGIPLSDANPSRFSDVYPQHLTSNAPHVPKTSAPGYYNPRRKPRPQNSNGSLKANKRKKMPGRPSHGPSDPDSNDAAMTTQWNQTIINTMQENGCEGTLEKCLIKQETRECRVQIVLKFGPKIARKQKSFSYKKFGYDGALLRADSYRRFVQAYKRLPSFQEEEKFFRDPSMALDMNKDDENQQPDSTDHHRNAINQQQDQCDTPTNVEGQPPRVAPVMVAPVAGQEPHVEPDAKQDPRDSQAAWSHNYHTGVFGFPGGAASNGLAQTLRSAMRGQFPPGTAHPYAPPAAYHNPSYLGVGDLMTHPGLHEKPHAAKYGPMCGDPSSVHLASPPSRRSVESVTPAPGMCRNPDESRHHPFSEFRPYLPHEGLQDHGPSMGPVDYLEKCLRGATETSSPVRKNGSLAWLDEKGSIFSIIASYLDLKDTSRVEQTCYLARTLVMNSTNNYASALVSLFEEQAKNEADRELFDALNGVFIGRWWGWILPAQRHNAFAKLQLAFVKGFEAGQAMRSEARRLYGDGFRDGETYPAMKTPTARVNRKQVKSACKTILALSRLERAHPGEASAIRHLVRAAEQTWVRWAL